MAPSLIRRHIPTSTVARSLSPQAAQLALREPRRGECMTLLHVSILLRDFKSFQRLLNIHGRPNLSSSQSQDASEDDPVKRPATRGSSDALAGDFCPARSSLGRPPPRHMYMHQDNTFPSVNVNEKDRDGRTALHLACSLPDCLEYVRLLLKHPSINVNVADAESHYTPLHRALYVANLPASLLLLQRPDIDATLKDYEGYTAFDLYNSTVEGTKPDRSDPDAELFMWGTNVNATLGFADGNSRPHPDQIIIQPKEYSFFPEPGPTIRAPIHVRQVAMSKLHTVVVTSEGCNDVGGGNLRMCGLGGSGRRLGSLPYHHSQQDPLSPLSPHAFPPNVQITKVAVGQDHTLALTKSGEVYSWGLNRFAQLGYVIRNQGDSTGAGGAGSWVHDGRTGDFAGRWMEGRGEGGKGSSTSLDDAIQHAPRRVQDALRKELVVGIAASKMASACWTEKGSLFTWGTNSGQLGHERSSPLQVLPRKVSKIVRKVTDVALSDTAMACLLDTGDVIFIWNDMEIKINFPIQTFPARIQAYRPPQAMRDACIAKLTTCDEVFAALSSNGEVFVFTPPDGSGGGSESSNTRKTALIKPQRAWVLKKKYRAVKDVALGANGNIVVCTESGHVFVRTRAPTKGGVPGGQTSDKGGAGASSSGSFTSSSITASMGGPSTSASNVAFAVQPGKIGTNFSFIRVPCLQRVTKVCANSTGAYGALKVVYRHDPIEIVGNRMAEDLKEVIPFVFMHGGGEWRGSKKGGRYGLGLNNIGDRDPSSSSQNSSAQATDSDDTDLDGVKDDVLQLKRLCDLIGQEKKGRRDFPKDRRLPFDADVVVVSQSDAAFPAHRVILAARSAELCSLLSGGKVLKDDKTNISIRFVFNKGKQSTTLSTSWMFPSMSTSGKLLISGCQVITNLILLTYLYCDILLALWDPRVGAELQKECTQLKIKPDQIKAELQTLATLLDLPLLSEALSLWVKRTPVPSVARDMEKLWLTTQSAGRYEGGSTRSNNPLTPDVLLELADREVWCHSILLRARSDLFASFFGEEVWTVNRWDDDGVIKVNMRHLRWDVMQYTFKFIFCGAEQQQFDRLDFAKSLDDVLDFLFSVIDAATELLLDRLVLICSSIILRHANIHNACYILNDATHYGAEQLIERLQTYMTANLETLLEQHMLDDIPHRLVKQLAAFARRKQAEKSPRSRTTTVVDAAMEKHAQWLALEDIPGPIVSLNWAQGKDIATARRKLKMPLGPIATPSTSPDAPLGIAIPQRTIRRLPSGGDIFMMDDADGPMTAEVSISSAKTSVWKPHSVPRVDMKLVMAEEAATSPPFKKALPISRAASKEGPTTPSPGSSLPRAASTSWRAPANLSTTPRKLTPTGTPHVTGVASVASTAREEGIKQSPSSVSVTRSQRSQVNMENRSTLGPVISPTRQPSTEASSIRRVSGKAWALPQVEPITSLTPTPVQAAPSVESFAAIQQLQLEQAFTGPSKDKRTLREIQAEEQARQQEEDFLRWWVAEEERVRLESEALSRAMAESMAGVSKARGKGRGGKGSKDRNPQAQDRSSPGRGHEGASEQPGAQDRRAKSRKTNQGQKQEIAKP